MTNTKRLISKILSVGLISLVLVSIVSSTGALGASATNTEISTLQAKAQRDGHVRVVVGMRLYPVTGPPTSLRSRPGAAARRQAVGQARSRLMAQLDPTTISNVRSLNYLPYVTMEVDAAALARLEQNPRVTSITADILYRITLNENSPLIGADASSTTAPRSASRVQLPRTDILTI